jgi:hypothetical protein
MPAADLLEDGYRPDTGRGLKQGTISPSHTPVGKNQMPCSAAPTARRTSVHLGKTRLESAPRQVSLAGHTYN